VTPGGEQAGAQHGTAQHGTAQPGTAQPGTAQHGTAQHGTAQPGTAQPGTGQPGTAPRGTAPGGTALGAAVEAALAGQRGPALSAGVERLMTAYRSGDYPDRPVLSSEREAAAYAAYRMPATAAAVSAAIRQLRLALPGWAPGSLADLGAGTGGAAWAAVAELPSLGSVSLYEQAGAAVSLGRAIFAASGTDVLRRAGWHRWRLPADDEPAARDGPDLATIDLVTAGYILGELSELQQGRLVTLAARAGTVVIVEPGTPAGHRRVLAARARLLGAGFTVVAPCPHQLACPVAAAGDWCHFAARLPRSAMHRQAKGAELSYEDEKFSYVAAVRDPARDGPGPVGRVIRRPQLRKNLVLLDLCASDGTSRRQLVGKGSGEPYRRARKAGWGDAWA
jgi:ribosomal protein RSM22 (predicted rRNA methylase)